MMALARQAMVCVLASAMTPALQAQCSNPGFFEVLTVAYPADAPGNAVLDKRTGMQWRRCEEGQRWDGASCQGTGWQLNHEQALRHAGTLGIWGLPDAKQLGSLPSRDCRFPALDGPVYATGELSRHYWSSTPLASASYAAWRLELDTGRVSYAQRAMPAGLRLSRR